MLSHSVRTLNDWLKLPFQKQIQSKLSLRKEVIDLMKVSREKDNNEVIDAWFSDECRQTMGAIVNKLSKK